MQTLAETLPEYAVLRSMAGVGDRLGPLILAEIGDIRRFHSGKALNAYAGNDAPPYQSGTFESHNRHICFRILRFTNVNPTIFLAWITLKM